MSYQPTSKTTEQIAQLCKEQIIDSRNKRADIVRAFDALVAKFPYKEGEIKESINFFSGMITAYNNIIIEITGVSMLQEPSLN